MNAVTAAPPLPVEIKGGIQICLPPSLKAMTTYIALEQEDWFEDEIRFVRQLLKPGQRAVDIGANYGLYTLAMAKAVGPSGQVWAFEPASAPCALLRRSVERNDLANVDILQCALSSIAGKRRMAAGVASELGRLANDETEGENVAVETLDGLLDTFGGAPIDFVKIDAEGEEERIITGADRFFAAHDPLIMFERVYDTVVDSARVKTEVNTAMIAALQMRGFALYRLAPGLDLLVPAEPSMIDGYQLNLFACRPARAARLEAEGVLVRSVVEIPLPDYGIGVRTIRTRPYFRAFASTANAPVVDASAQLYRAALDRYAEAHNPARTPASRWAALRESVAMLTAVTMNAPTLPRALTLTRVAAEAGLRQTAQDVISQLLPDPAIYGASALIEPFLPPSARFDEIDPGNDADSWCAVSMLDAMERLRYFSSYFSKGETLPYLETFRESRFFSPELERRRQLIRIYTGRQAGPEPTPILSARGDGHLNVGFWTGRT